MRTREDLVRPAPANHREDRRSRHNAEPCGSYVIVSGGGFLGPGAKDVAVPARRLTRQGNELVPPSATKQALLGLPAFHFAR